MKRLPLLPSAAIGIVIVMTVTALVLPGVLAQPQEDDRRPGHVELREITIETGEISGDSASLFVDAYLDHRGETARNVSVVYRAIDGESGLQKAVKRIDLGDISSDGEKQVNTTISVERSGSHRIEVLVYRDDRRIDRGGKQVHGLDALTPEYARTSVEFHQFDRRDLPPIEYSVQDAGKNRTALNTSVYLTNSGSTTTDLRVVLTARQADSNIVAARERMSVGQIDPGETVTPSTNLTVPSGYNYYLDAVLWKDDVIVGTARSTANLDPERRISVNESVRDVSLEVSDFEQDGDSSMQDPQRTPTRTEEIDTQTPGFGFGITGIALLLGIVIIGRRYND